MKKLILISLFIIPLFASSQNFPLVKDGGIWRVGGSQLVNHPNQFTSYKNQYFIFGDTILLSKTFKKVYSTNYDSLIYNKTYIGAMREDSIASVFFITDSNNCIPYCGWSINSTFNEKKLYDFSLEVGDTFFVQNSPDSIHIVNLIDSVLISGQWRKRINFIQNSLSKRVWIEGIGDTKGLFFPFQFEFENAQVLTCYEDSQIFWNNPDWPYNCFSVGIEEESIGSTQTSEIKLYPNPATSEITFDFKNFNQEQDFEILIYNAVGIEVKKESLSKNNQTKTINIKDLNSGIYYYRIISNSQFYSGKFIKI